MRLLCLYWEQMSFTKRKKETEMNIGSFKFFKDVLFKVLNISSMLWDIPKSDLLIFHIFSYFPLKIQEKYRFSKIFILLITFFFLSLNSSYQMLKYYFWQVPVLKQDMLTVVCKHYIFHTILRNSSKLIIPTGDINIELEELDQYLIWFTIVILYMNLKS